MGSYWRIMPLLSTLAALVIIVHSAEEDLEPDYRYDLKHQTFEIVTPGYDPAWRAARAEAVDRESPPVDVWQDPPEDTLKRRRPNRKRKRRPVGSSSEEKQLEIEMIPFYANPTGDHSKEEGRYRETDAVVRYRDTEYSEQATEGLRRRRTKPENRRHRWTDEYSDIERPLRRRSQRRKRPPGDSPPISRLTEFNEHNDNVEQVKPRLEAPLMDNYETNYNGERREVFNVDFSSKFLENSNFSEKQEQSDTPTTETTMITKEVTEAFSEEPARDNQQIKEDVSEFSYEIMRPIQVTRPTYGSAERKKAPAGPPANFKLADRPIDPMALKEILKRSNGTSLSEILQQRNLSLSDLLYGKEEALALIQTKGLLDQKQESTLTEQSSEETKEEIVSKEINQKKQTMMEVETESTTVTVKDTSSSDNNSTVVASDLESQSTGIETTPRIEVKENSQNTPKISTNKRRFSNVRRKLRMRPAINNNYKGQLNRDLMALTARRYQNSRNMTKSKEWKYVIPLMNDTGASEDLSSKELAAGNSVVSETPTTTTTVAPEETTVMHDSDYYNQPTIMIETQNAVTIKIDSEENDEIIETTEASVTTTQETTTAEITTTTVKPKMSRLRPTANRMGLRRQAFNNRLKRKRMKQKNSTTEPPAEHEAFELDLFGMPNLVSSSEFIARTQTPKPAKLSDGDDDFTTLEDFITTEKSRHEENGQRFTRNSTIPEKDTEEISTEANRFSSTTEETAKFEIEEILNDTRTSARLSRILMERNMTLNELVEHRERGSSHVHLADIFHNASKEPNPPEPFLSKSLIEPISKETYPLRAIIEANLHDPKATTIEPNAAQAQYINIPVVMDFGNNVNENGENMGIMSLFNKLTDNDVSSVENTEVGQDSEGTPYVTTVIAVNNTANETTREGRVLKRQDYNLKHDVLGWKELFELVKRSHENETEREIPTSEDSEPTKIVISDTDDDGLIVLEDLGPLKGIDSNIETPSEERVNSFEREEVVQPGILDRPPSNTRSVTVATASIVGLALVLFLLTYAAFKWKQQRVILRQKQNFNEERIPSPVFESRKSHKINCSTRSISPMLATSNIYTMNTLDSNNGKESPDYMWDSLRKPFQ